MEYLHSRKPPVCYRDLKPDNLMFSETGHLYLIDLGSAMFDHGKRKQICEGTKGYASPEQYQGYLRPGSDIYALGKTLESQRRNGSGFYGFFLASVSECTRKQEKYSIQTCQWFKKRIQKLENRYRMITWRKQFIEKVGGPYDRNTDLKLTRIAENGRIFCGDLRSNRFVLRSQRYPEDSKDREKCSMAAEKTTARVK